ncbi:hypothetical protein [Burkholderia sp. Bp9004]|uniref:hypothetical protein n=1 Tax=Burkholderia sp. Bp9004 TaxID=2184559 RepID=UPI000F5E8B9B|nr:hypothetical protein [Burkholderia sp. Bp9004]
MAATYVSTQFTFQISASAMERVRNGSQVNISVDTDYHAVYFQAFSAGDPPQGDERGIGIQIYSGGGAIGNPISQLIIKPQDIWFTLTKPASGYHPSDLTFDLFLWATPDIENRSFGLTLEGDLESGVNYGFEHGVAINSMNSRGTTVIPWPN